MVTTLERFNDATIHDFTISRFHDLNKCSPFISRISFSFCSSQSRFCSNCSPERRLKRAKVPARPGEDRHLLRRHYRGPTLKQTRNAFANFSKRSGSRQDRNRRLLLFIARIFRRDRLHRFNLRCRVCGASRLRDLSRRRNRASAKWFFTRRPLANRENGCAK